MPPERFQAQRGHALARRQALRAAWAQRVALLAQLARHSLRRGSMANILALHAELQVSRLLSHPSA